jgi:hypothetical protein
MKGYLFLNLDTKPVEWAVIVAHDISEAVSLTGWECGTVIVTEIEHSAQGKRADPWLVAKGKMEV